MVKFVTKFNGEITMDLNKHVLKKLLLPLIIIALLFTGCGINSIISDGDWIFGIVIIAFGVLYVPIVWLLTRIIQKRHNKSMYIMSEETISTFTFTEDKMCIEEVKCDKYKANVEASYEYLYKVDETATHYFLYISKQQCHVIPKCDLVEGTLEELNILLFNNLGPKFNFKKSK